MNADEMCSGEPVRIVQEIKKTKCLYWSSYKHTKLPVSSSTTGSTVTGIIEEHRQINQWPQSDARARYRRAH